MTDGQSPDGTPIIRTVLGDIPAPQAGVVLPHEHLISDSTVWRQEPVDDIGRALAESPITLDTLWWHRQYPNTSRDVMVVDDVDLLVEELAAFSELGGGTLVDLTPEDLGRDPAALVEISRRSGVHVVASTGHYIAAAHPPTVASSSADELAAGFAAEVTEGIADSGVRAGVIGEIGVSNPMHPDEEKVLRAAARASLSTGAAVSVHTAAHAITSNSALEVLRVLDSEGLPADRIVLGHMDTTLHRAEYQREVARSGAYLEFDLFGHELFETENDFQSFGDTETARTVAQLFDEGFGDRLLLSHDICYRLQLRRYGGYGYGHLLRNVRRRLELWGLPSGGFEAMTRTNPQRVLALGGDGGFR